MLEIQQLKTEKVLCDRLFDSDQAYWAIEEKLDEIWPEHFDHIGWDHYDWSIEIYFSPETPTDFAARAEQLTGIWEMGFARAYLNFCDRTEQHATKAHLGERKRVNTPRWSKEAHAERRLHIDKILNPLKTEIESLKRQLSDIDLALSCAAAETPRGECVANWIVMCHDYEMQAKALKLIENHKIMIAPSAANDAIAEPWTATAWHGKIMVHSFGATPADAVIRLAEKLEALIDNEIRKQKANTDL